MVRLKGVVLEMLQHQDADDRLLRKIIDLKNESWPYGEESQREWLKKNMGVHDWHCLLWAGDDLTGYCTLSEVVLDINGCTSDILGLGCVCVASKKKGHGWGATLSTLVSQLIRDSGHAGMLICRDDLVGFYQNNGNWLLWDKSQGEDVFFGGNPIGANVMTLSLSPESARVSIDRVF